MALKMLFFHKTFDDFFNEMNQVFYTIYILHINKLGLEKLM